jgi:uncharacterized protein
MPSERIEASELRELAAASALREERVEIRRLPRIVEALHAAADVDATVIDVRVKFERGANGFSRLHVEVSGELPLRCERCLQSMHWPLRLDTRLTVLNEDREAEELAEPFDSVVMEDGALSLDTVIEDEILAALPMVPAHDRSECSVALPQAKTEDNETEQTYRPFAELAGLVGRDRDER